MTFRDSVYERARRAGRRIVLPEGTDERVRAAATRIERERLGTVQLLEGPAPRSLLPEMTRLLRTRHPDRFPTDVAAAAALEHPLTFGAALVGLGRADVMVGGATFPSGDTIRAALWAVGAAPGITTVSGAFYMVRDDAVLTFTDCAVVPEPSPEQLADAAVAAARDRRRIVGDEPIVALLSYSTKGSAAGPRVERVRPDIPHFLPQPREGEPKNRLGLARCREQFLLAVTAETLVTQVPRARCRYGRRYIGSEIHVAGGRVHAHDE